ncbi:MAG: TRAP transporter small permease subunit [Pseudomonadota bacterium]
MLVRVRKTLESVLEWFVIIQMVLLTIVVITAVLYRLIGDSLSWYDEIAAIQLSWLTYYGAALAALKRRHIGFDSVLLSLPQGLRLLGVAVAEIIVIGFFVILAITGWEVLQVLEGERLVSLTWVPVQLTQSVIPIGGVLFVLCELLSLPEYYRLTRDGISLEHAEIEEEVESEMEKAGNR